MEKYKKDTELQIPMEQRQKIECENSVSSGKP